MDSRVTLLSIEYGTWTSFTLLSHPSPYTWLCYIHWQWSALFDTSSWLEVVYRIPYVINNVIISISMHLRASPLLHHNFSKEWLIAVPKVSLWSAMRKHASDVIISISSKWARRASWTDHVYGSLTHHFGSLAVSLWVRTSPASYCLKTRSQSTILAWQREKLAACDHLVDTSLWTEVVYGIPIQNQ